MSPLSKVSPSMSTKRMIAVSGVLLETRLNHITESLFSEVFTSPRTLTMKCPSVPSSKFWVRMAKRIAVSILALAAGLKTVMAGVASAKVVKF